ncbi:unnamed protein product [Vicia faba]|uniref:Uncharacterized protein n=1 Tax=Vicia faba TaxID=3906 RepID=A0AAV1AT51_VICFA|nr:unnamed protein product [Vicia faba]
MGAKLCTLSGLSFKDCIKPKENRTLKMKKVKKISRKLGFVDDWVLDSQEMKQSKKKVHPCSTRFRGELAKDSLCLSLVEKTKNRLEEVDEGLTSYCSRKINRVRFKLPHTVIYYEPEESYYEEDDEEEERREGLLKAYYDSEEYSFSSPNWRELYSFETTEEPILKLAVDTLPHVFVSSKVSI